MLEIWIRSNTCRKQTAKEKSKAVFAFHGSLMTDAEIKANIASEVARQLAGQPRIVQREPLRKVVHRPITSNQPGSTK